VTAPPPRLVLASASPRRAALMRQLDLPFEQIVSPLDEPSPGDESPREHALVSALFKARAVAGKLGDGGGRAIVLGADTVVCLDDEVLGKPVDQGDAARMLRALSGRAHTVYTGVALVCPEGRELSACEETRVYMTPITEPQIARYVASHEPMDKAGAYAVQGRGGRFVERLEGCYYNVVGLPLARLCSLLAEAGFNFGAVQLPPPKSD